MKLLFWQLVIIFVMSMSFVACDEDNDSPDMPEDPNGGISDTVESHGGILDSVAFDEMIFVEGGTFLMGAQSSNVSMVNNDPNAKQNESPIHQVTLGDYYICKYEVTQEFWEYVMSYNGTTANGETLNPVSDVWFGKTPNGSKGKYYPAYNVSWNEVVNVFIERLNAITGKEYRLPTEAEWEYAARGGQKNLYTKTYTTLNQNKPITKTYMLFSGSRDADVVAWHSANSSMMVQKVGKKLSNELGLYDMSGNISEWCADWYGEYSSESQLNPGGLELGDERVCRGGSWNDIAVSCRVSHRDSAIPEEKSDYIGFRLVYKEKEIDINPETPILPGDNGDVFKGMEKDEMVFVEGGTFLMGVQSSDPNAPNYSTDSNANEYIPMHEETVGDFYIGKYEVTQQLWEYVMNYSGFAADGSEMSAHENGAWGEPIAENGLGDYYPMYNVGYPDINNYFISRLNQITGGKYRLPTGAEWEYAARGGNRSKGYKYSGSNNVGDVAWYGENSKQITHVVGTRVCNELGIYDMSGNVYEYTTDWLGKYNGQDYQYGRCCIKGGAYNSEMQQCLILHYGFVDPYSRLSIIGFRLALSAD